MEKETVTVISTSNGVVGITLPEIHFRKEWSRKGQKQKIDKELLNEIMYDPGTAYMFNTGMLYIEDMEVKKELGLEPGEAKEPVNIIVLDEGQMKRYLTVMPVHEFKEKIKNLSLEQIRNLADYAVEHELADFTKAGIIKEAIDFDIIRAIQLDRANKED